MKNVTEGGWFTQRRVDSHEQCAQRTTSVARRGMQVFLLFSFSAA